MTTVVSLNEYTAKKTEEANGVSKSPIELLENIIFNVIESTYGLPGLQWMPLVAAEAGVEVTTLLGDESNVSLVNMLTFNTRDLQTMLNTIDVTRLPMSKTVIVDNGETWQTTKYPIPLLAISIGSTTAGKTVRPLAITTKLHTFDPENNIDRVSILSSNDDVTQITKLAWNKKLTDHGNLLHPRSAMRLLDAYAKLADCFSMGYSYTNTDDDDGNVVLSFTKLVATGSAGVLIAEYVLTINTSVYDITYET